MLRKIGLLGGTFDPIHIGHLRLALELKQQLNLSEMRLLPCHKPAHREMPKASSEQRFAMLRTALQDCRDLELDGRELLRDKTSYTYDTLRELRGELGDEVSLVLCMGVDAFAGINRWHCWQQLIQFAHIVVVARPGWSLPCDGDVERFLLDHEGDASSLSCKSSGSVVLQTLRLLPISATEIRQLIHNGESAQFLVPDKVLQYIEEQNLYR